MMTVREVADRYGVTAGEFDAVGRDNKNDPKGRSILFARYVGAES